MNLKLLKNLKGSSFLPAPQGGFALLRGRPRTPVGAVGQEAFPPFGIKPNIKEKQFSIPFKRKGARAKYKKLKENCFAEFIPHSIAGLGEIRRAEVAGWASKLFPLKI